jgi:hypothetical protein
MHLYRKENRKKPAHLCRLKEYLLNMAVIIDVILTVAVISSAPGAIPEFQFRICDVCFTANSAPVSIGCFCCGFGRIG